MARARRRQRNVQRGLKQAPRPGVWLSRHGQVALSTLGELVRKPLGSLMTVLVVAIAMALPAGLFLLLQQVEGLSNQWQQTTSVSLFLKPDVEDEAALALAAGLESRSDVAAVKLLTSDDSMAEFRGYSGFGNMLDVLDENPLPGLLLIEPGDPEDVDAIEVLVETLQDLPEQDLVQFDQQWLRRFHAMTAIGQRAALVLGASLGLAVLLIVGNTIRLEIQSRRPEIEITKLVGATNAFVRRPFLYRGLWFGVSGGMLAWMLTGMALTALGTPVAELAGLYGSEFRLTAWQPLTLTGLLGAGAALGLGGAWIAVGRHLQAITPS